MLLLRFTLVVCLSIGFLAAFAPSVIASSPQDTEIDLSHAVIVARNRSTAHLPEQTAALVLSEEIKKRTGLTLEIQNKWPTTGPVIALTGGGQALLDGVAPPSLAHGLKPEGYALVTDRSQPDRPVVWIAGADGRGALFGAGKLLRVLNQIAGSVKLNGDLEMKSSPEYPIRGHQLGYRAQANSYDAWSPAQFDQYIRELALFGTNSIEGIPFNDDRPTVNSYPREKMNVDLSRICAKYGQDYWLWVPADLDLGKKDLREKALRRNADLFRECPTLTGIFVAGGDPGDNAPQLVIPYLADLAKELAKHHPNGRIWLSLQGYSLEHQDFVYRWLEKEQPKWLGGIAAGPSSPPLAELRSRVPAHYPIRDYPDITHCVRAQFPVPYWDPAFSFTLGRECVNPRPLFFTRVFRDTAPFTNGFISYSDGCHDDVNKVLWSALAWDSSSDPNEILTEYSRLFFGSSVADSAAAGLFAFERDWEGALATNGGVDATFALWQELDRRSPQLKINWRWQMCLLRANYDYYIRKRLIFESNLEELANSAMLAADKTGATEAMDRVLEILGRATPSPVLPEVSARIEQLCDDLFHSIGLQTSVTKYQACSPERGCVLDYLYYPLNNRWWIEDQLAAVKKIPTESERVTRLHTLATWEKPGPGSFYDDIGNIAKSPHEVRNEKIAGPLLDVDNMNLPGLMFWVDKSPLARSRQSWFSDEGWPTALKYPKVDPNSEYLVRTTGVGDCLLRVNGVRLAPTLNGRKVGEIKEFPIPRVLYRDGQITLTFDPTFEPDLNWREQSRLTEIWLIKR